MTLTGHDVNKQLEKKSLKDYATLADLAEDLGIDTDLYFFLGRRFENDPKPIHLVPHSQITNLHEIKVMSYTIGG